MAEVKLPQNSDKALNKRNEEEEHKVEAVIQSPPKARKKSLSKRIGEAITPDNTDDVKGFILFDCILPAIKDTIYDTFTGALKMMLFHDDSPSRRRTRRDGNKTYVSYSGYSDYSTISRREREKEYSRLDRKAAMDFTEFVFDNRAEAEEVLGALNDLTIEYGKASVSDLYSLVGHDHEYTTNKYGWTDLSNAYISKTREGYVINLPRPKLIG